MQTNLHKWLMSRMFFRENQVKDLADYATIGFLVFAFLDYQKSAVIFLPSVSRLRRLLVGTS